MARLQRVLRLVFPNVYYYRVDYIRTFEQPSPCLIISCCVARLNNARCTKQI